MPLVLEIEMLQFFWSLGFWPSTSVSCNPACLFRESESEHISNSGSSIPMGEQRSHCLGICPRCKSKEPSNPDTLNPGLIHVRTVSRTRITLSKSTKGLVFPFARPSPPSYLSFSTDFYISPLQLLSTPSLLRLYSSSTSRTRCLRESFSPRAERSIFRPDISTWGGLGMCAMPSQSCGLWCWVSLSVCLQACQSERSR